MITFGMAFTIVTSVLFWGVTVAVIARILRASGFWPVGEPAAAKQAVKRRLPYKPLRPRGFDHRLHNMRPYQLKIRVQRLRQNRRRVKRMPDFKPYCPKDGHSSWQSIALFAIGIRLAFLVVSVLLLWFNGGYFPTIATLFYRTQGWDNYAMIAEKGYFYAEYGRNVFLAFFPLYVFMIRLLAVIVRDYMVAAYIISFASYVAGVVYLHRLVRLDFSNSTAWWAIFLISVVPPGLFFGTPMTESLMLLTSAATLYYIRSHRWALAGVAGAFATFTRMVGVMLIVAAVVEFVTHYRFVEYVKKARWDQVWWLVSTKGLWILLMFAGVLGYLMLNTVVSGNPFQFLYYQSTQWHNNTQYFGRTVMGQFRQIVATDNYRWVRGIFAPNIIGFGFAVVMLTYGCLKKFSPALIVYGLGYIFISFSPSWLLAGARYTLVCLPVFIFLADYVDKKPVRGLVVTGLFIMVLFPFLSLFLDHGVF